MNRVKEIFAEALERHGADRAAYLDQACADDPELRAEVEAFLTAATQTDAFRDTTAPTLSERPGTTIGRYKLLEQIGEGGFGVVFMAQQEAPVRRRVALKIIKLGMDTKQVVARFEAERQALAMMDHPNIAKVFDGGATDTGRPYFVMELVRGVPITDYCDANNLPVHQRLKLFIQVCEAVQHAHQKGLIHRDLKPTNVLVSTQDDRPVAKVIDFGIAKATQAELTAKTLFTEFHQMVGTPEYMSPEQAGGSLDIDTRSDVYSLGVLLYELLAGSTPFDPRELRSKAFAEMQRIIREVEPPVPSTRLSSRNETLASVAAHRSLEPRKLAAIVRGELDWIVMRCLEKDRKRRYESAASLAADVNHHLADEPVSASPPSTVYRFRKLVRRNKLPFAAAGTVVVAVALGTAVSAYYAIAAAARGHAAVAAQHATESALADKEVALSDRETALKAKDQALAAARENESVARNRFYAAQMNLATDAWEANQPARTVDLLESARPWPAEHDLRGFEWYYLYGLSHRGLIRTWRVDWEIITDVAWSPDGTLIATGSWTNACLWDSRTGALIGELPSSGIWRVAFSPDGKTLATASSEGGELILWDVPTRRERLRITAFSVDHGIRSLAFSPDGQIIATGAHEGVSQDNSRGVVKLWSAVNGRLMATLKGHHMVVGSLAFSPDGKYLASAGFAWGGVYKTVASIILWDLLKFPDVSQRWELPHAGAFKLAFSSDGQTLFAAGDSDIRQIDVTDGTVSKIMHGHVGSVESLCLIPGDKHLASCSDDHTLRLWDLKTGESTVVGAELGLVECIAVDPTGKRIICGDNQGWVSLRTLDPPPDPQPFKQNSPVNALAFTPDGGSVIAAGAITNVLDSVTLVQRQPGPKNVLAVSPDCTQMAAYDGHRYIMIVDAVTQSSKNAIEVGTINRATFSSDGKLLATWDSVSERPDLWKVDLWKVESGTLVDRVQCEFMVEDASFAPGSHQLAVGLAFHDVLVYDIDKGTQTTYPVAASLVQVGSTAYSPDGHTLAVGLGDGSAVLFDVGGSSQLNIRSHLHGHTLGIRSMAFTHDSGTLATVGKDQAVRLWDVANGEERITLNLPAKQLAFSPDDTRLAIYDDNNNNLRMLVVDQNAAAHALRTWRDQVDPQSPTQLAAAAASARESGDLARVQQNLQAAIRALETEIGIIPTDRARQLLSSTRTALADLFRAQGKPAAAEAVYRDGEAACRELIHAEPNSGEPYVLLGDLLASQRKFTEALAAYSEVIRLMPDTAEAWAARGECYRQMDQFVNMAEDYSKASMLLPDMQRYWHEIGYAYMQLGDHQNALAAHTKTIELGDTDSEERLRRGKAYEGLGELSKAEADYSRAVELDPTNDRAWYRRARVNGDLGQYENAIADYTKGIELKPDVTLFWLARADCWTALGQTEKAAQDRAKAITLLDDELKSTPNDAWAHNNLAWQLATMPDEKLRDPKRAVELGEKAVQLAPMEGDFWNTLGVARYRAGDFKQAINDLEKSISLRNGGSSEDFFFLAMAHWQLGQRTDARTWYDKAVAWMDKNSPQSPELLRFRPEGAELLRIPLSNPASAPVTRP